MRSRMGEPRLPRLLPRMTAGTYFDAPPPSPRTLASAPICGGACAVALLAADAARPLGAGWRCASAAATCCTEQGFIECGTAGLAASCEWALTSHGAQRSGGAGGAASTSKAAAATANQGGAAAAARAALAVFL